jgi:hypothetical protein
LGPARAVNWSRPGGAAGAGGGAEPLWRPRERARAGAEPDRAAVPLARAASGQVRPPRPQPPGHAAGGSDRPARRRPAARRSTVPRCWGRMQRWTTPVTSCTRVARTKSAEPPAVAPPAARHACVCGQHAPCSCTAPRSLCCPIYRPRKTDPSATSLSVTYNGQAQSSLDLGRAASTGAAGRGVGRRPAQCGRRGSWRALVTRPLRAAAPRPAGVVCRAARECLSWFARRATATASTARVASGPGRAREAKSARAGDRASPACAFAAGRASARTAWPAPRASPDSRCTTLTGSPRRHRPPPAMR